MKTVLLVVALPLVAPHSSLINPKPRNAIDSELPAWKDGASPYNWVEGMGKAGAPCACRNGSKPCASAQTCLWFNVGTTIGCKVPDGGDTGPSNPNKIDRCGSGMNATNNDPTHRTINRGAKAGSDADWTRWNPWRAPGHAPVYDACGRASGSYQATPGKGEFTDTKYAKLGDLGSKVLPKYDTGTVWRVGSTVETMTSFRTNHGGGYQFRLCPADNLTKACFQQTPMPFVGNSKLMIADGSIIDVESVDVSTGTLPVGSTWRMLAIVSLTWRVLRSAAGPSPHRATSPGILITRPNFRPRGTAPAIGPTTLRCTTTSGSRMCRRVSTSWASAGTARRAPRSGSPVQMSRSCEAIQLFRFCDERERR